MRKLFIILLSVISILFLGFSCYKKLSGFITVTGRVLDWYTGEPKVTKVFLITENDVNRNYRDYRSHHLGSVSTDKQGFFNLKTKPGTLGFYAFGINGLGSSRVDIQENKSNDLGVMFIGGTSIFCKLNIVARSDSFIQIVSNIPNMDFSKGTTKQVLLSSFFNQLPVGGKQDLKFYINYRTSINHWTSQGAYSTNEVFIPIKNLTDTLEATIYY